MTEAADQCGDKELGCSRGTLITTVLIVGVRRVRGGRLGRDTARYGARPHDPVDLGAWTVWLGRLVFSGVSPATGCSRPAIVAPVPFFVIGILLVRLAPLRRGIAAAGNTESAVL